MTSTRLERRRQADRIIVGDSYLTPREYQIIAAYMDGARQADIPNAIGCARRTIDSHIRVAKDRLGARTIHQLIAMVATADAIRERGCSSNRESASGEHPERAQGASMPLTVTSACGAAPPRSLTR
jgi:DNA-binding CsgD family transcriptional regulator